MLSYKFKHLEKHHRQQICQAIYEATRNHITMGELLEKIDVIIDIYLSKSDVADNESEENADACNLLKVAIEKGNEYRAEVRPIMDWVKETVESGIMTEAEALKIAYPKMQEVHNRIYKKE